MNALRNHRGAIIADEMGLGKTAQAIAVWAVLDPPRTLVVCPAVMTLKWREEFRRWVGAEAQVIRGRDALTQRVGIISYDLLRRRSDLHIPYDVLILDEAHYIKSVHSQRSALFRRTPLRESAHFLMLTGTPLVNRPDELWPLLHLADYRLAGNYSHFIREFCALRQTKWGVEVTGVYPWKEKELRDRLGQVMIRRRKADVLKELPPAVESIITLERSGYNALLQEEQFILGAAEEVDWENLDFARLRIPVLGQLERIRARIAEKKAPAVVEYVRDLDPPVVIFGIHVDAMRIVAQELKAPLLYGATPPERRQELVRAFQAGKLPYMIVSARAGGVGIDLTASCRAVFLELDYSPAVIAQARDRLHRIGQLRTVWYDYMVVEGSVEEHIAHRLARKIQLAKKILS